jgi:hypothetical protein
MTEQTIVSVKPEDLIVKTNLKHKSFSLITLIIAVVSTAIVFTIAGFILAPSFNPNINKTPSPIVSVSVTPGVSITIKPTDNSIISATHVVVPSASSSTTSDWIEYDLTPLKLKIDLPKSWSIKKDYSFGDSERANLALYTFVTIIDGKVQSITLGKSEAFSAEACLGIGTPDRCYSKTYKYKILGEDIKCNAAVGFYEGTSRDYQRSTNYEMMVCDLASIKDHSGFLSNEPLRLFSEGVMTINDVTLSSEEFNKILLSIREY